MYTTRNLITDAWSYVRPYKAKFFLATFLRMVADLSWLYPPYAFAIIINFFANYDPVAALTPLYVAFVLTFVASAIRYCGIYSAKSLMFKTSEKIVLDAQLASLKHLMRLDISWHEKESSGGKYKRIERGAAGLDRIFRIWINNVIEIAINLIGVISIILSFDLLMGATVALFLITYYLLAHFYRKRGIVAANIVNEQEEIRSGLLFETINNIRSVKVMSMSEKISDTISKNAIELLESIKKRIFWFQAGTAVRNFYAQIFRLGVIIFIVYGIIEGRYEIVFLVIFIGYFDRVWASISELTDISEEFAIAKNSISRMQEIFLTPITIDDERGKLPFPQKWKTISFKDVSFSYGEQQVLKNVTFKIKRGEKIGIVGLSGAGKSTLFKLLLKEHESYTGEIYIDETPLREISKKDYFTRLAVVLQETELFNASLRDNITISNTSEEANHKALDHVLEIAHVKDFIAKLPEQTDTIIGEKGVKLSGGEKQRVGIARAIFKTPEIFLLDEATSHLDIESEKKIQDSLHKFFKSVTAIVIAHRLTTIKEMDKIIVMEHGKIIESGNFAKLHAAQGRFFELWEQQKL